MSNKITYKFEFSCDEMITLLDYLYEKHRDVLRMTYNDEQVSKICRLRDGIRKDKWKQDYKRL